MSEHKPETQEEYSFYNLFVPLTTKKAIFIIIVVGCIVYFNMLFNGFVWDDKTYLIGKPDVHTLNIFQLIGNNIFNIGGYYRPLTAIYFAILYAIFNASSFYYHFFQLVLHIACGVLLFFLFKKFFKLPISLLLSLIFVIHPIQVESVSYISSSDSPLIFIFGISALLFSTQKSNSIRKTVLIFLLLLLSVLTKEAGILFLFFVLLYRFIFIRKNILAYFIGAIATVLIYLVIRFEIGKVFFAKPLLDPIARLPFKERLINIPAIVTYYLKTFFYPAHLAIDQFWIIKNITLTSFYLPLFIIIVFFFALFLLGYKLFKSNKKTFSIFLFFVNWYIVGMLLYVQFTPLDMTVADRWFYVPIVGLLGILGIILEYLVKHGEKTKKICYTFAVIIIVMLSIRTIVRNSNWIDAKTLYTHDSQVLDNFDIENSLGSEYNAENNYKEALIYFKKSVALDPYEVNLFNVGSQYEKLGNIHAAENYYAMAITKPHYLLIPQKHLTYTYERYGYVLLFTNNFQKANMIANVGLKEYPNDVNLWIVLALSKYKLHNQEQALDAAIKAKTLLSVQQTNYIYNQILNKNPIQIPQE